jgi:hypothetical protein
VACPAALRPAGENPEKRRNLMENGAGETANGGFRRKLFGKAQTRRKPTQKGRNDISDITDIISPVDRVNAAVG